MNKKVILSIIGGCAVLSLCGCVISMAVFGKQISDAINKGIKDGTINLTPAPTGSEPTNTVTTTPKTTKTPTQGSTVNSFVTYANSSEGIEIGYPKDWTKEENVSGTIAMFKSPQANSSDTFRENINIVTEDLQGESLTIKEYTDLSLENLEASPSITNFNLIESNPTTINGVSAYSVVYTGTTSNLNLKWRQVYLIKNGTAYVLTLTSEPTQFSTVDRTAQEVFRTFKIR